MIIKERVRNKLNIKGKLKEVSLDHLNTEKDVEDLIELYRGVILYNEDENNDYVLQSIAYETETNVLILVFDERPC